jgi:hypothetical protein
MGSIAKNYQNGHTDSRIKPKMTPFVPVVTRSSGDGFYFVSTSEHSVKIPYPVRGPALRDHESGSPGSSLPQRATNIRGLDVSPN